VCSSDLQDSVGFGLSLGLSGNTLAIGYQRDAQIGSTRGVYVFERNGTWAASATPVARLTAPTTAKNFGFDVAVDGTTIAVSSPGSGSPFFVYGGNSNPFSPVFIFQKQGGWRNGSANAVASLLPTASINDIPFGGQIALSGNTLIAGSVIAAGGASFDHILSKSGSGLLTITGRESDMYISGGSNVYPREVEEVLLTHPGVAEVAIVGMPDAKWGEIGVAVVVRRAGFEALDEPDLRAHLDGRSARYRWPQRWHFWAELPKSGYGKILKREIKERLNNLAI
jgi:hypothetical protein